jgi:hypothetical protein
MVCFLIKLYITLREYGFHLSMDKYRLPPILQNFHFPVNELKTLIWYANKTIFPKYAID